MIKKLILGTSSQSKVEYYRSLLKNKKFQLLTLDEFSDVPPIEEDLFDIVGNSLKKAITYAKHSDIPTISDDTGVFIPALHDEPGVAARRWAGKLPADISDQEWEQFFLKQIKTLKLHQTNCYKRKVVTLALPNGTYFQEEIMMLGKVLVNPRPKYIPGSPFSAYFFVDKFDKFEAELNEKQQREFYREAKNKILKLLNKLNM